MEARGAFGLVEVWVVAKLTEGVVSIVLGNLGLWFPFLLVVPDDVLFAMLLLMPGYAFVDCY